MKVSIGCVKVNPFVFGQLALDAHHSLNCLTYIESLDLLSESAFFDLGIVKKVLHQEAHQASTRLLHLMALSQLVKQVI